MAFEGSHGFFFDEKKTPVNQIQESEAIVCTGLLKLNSRRLVWGGKEKPHLNNQFALTAAVESES